MKFTKTIGIATITIALASPAFADSHAEMEKSDKQPAVTVMKDGNGMKMVVYPEGYMLVMGPESKTPDVIVKFKGDETEWTLKDVAGPHMCEGPGKYSSKSGDDGLVMITLISDDCEARKNALDGATWTPVMHKE